MERIINRLDQTAEKWEFIYKEDFDENIEFYVKEGTPYVIVYGRDKKEMYLDGKSRVLLRRKNHTLYSEYRKVRGDIKRELYLKPYQVTVTKKMRVKGLITRYFAQYYFDKRDTIFEIKKQDFNKRTQFYKTVSLDWVLTGIKENVRISNIDALDEADKVLSGIKYHLDPLEFYIDDNTQKTKLEKVQEKLNRLKHY